MQNRYNKHHNVDNDILSSDKGKLIKWLILKGLFKLRCLEDTFSKTYLNYHMTYMTNRMILAGFDDFVDTLIPVLPWQSNVPYFKTFSFF